MGESWEHHIRGIEEDHDRACAETRLSLNLPEELQDDCDNEPCRSICPFSITISEKQQCAKCGNFVLTNKRRDEVKEGGGYCKPNGHNWYIHISMIWSTPCPAWIPSNKGIEE